MEQILILILVLVAIALVALVLIQHGKGADAGAAFGSGASNTMFGSQGATSFLFKLTMGLAVLFFVLAIILSRLAADQAHNNGLQNLPKSQQSQSTNTNIQTPNIPIKK